MTRESLENDEPADEPVAEGHYGERSDGWGNDVANQAEKAEPDTASMEGIDRLDGHSDERIPRALGQLSLSNDGWGDDWRPDDLQEIEHDETPDARVEAEGNGIAMDQQSRMDDARDEVARQYRVSEAREEVDAAHRDAEQEPEVAVVVDAGDGHDAVRTYTGEDTGDLGNYRPLNLGLREGFITDVERVAQDSHDLSAGLRDLPTVSGEVYRKIPERLGQEAIDRYAVGATVVENAYTSASFRPDLHWGNGNVGMIIESKRGRDISGHSELPFEQEVLFDRFSRFEVVEKEYDEQADYWSIRLREL